MCKDMLFLIRGITRPSRSGVIAGKFENFVKYLMQYAQCRTANVRLGWVSKVFCLFEQREVPCWRRPRYQSLVMFRSCGVASCRFADSWRRTDVTLPSCPKSGEICVTLHSHARGTDFLTYIQILGSDERSFRYCGQIPYTQYQYAAATRQTCAARVDAHLVPTYHARKVLYDIITGPLADSIWLDLGFLHKKDTS